LVKLESVFGQLTKLDALIRRHAAQQKNKRNKTSKVFRKIIEASSDNGTGQFAAECEKAPATEGDLTSYGAYKNVPIFWPPSRYT